MEELPYTAFTYCVGCNTFLEEKGKDEVGAGCCLQRRFYCIEWAHVGLRITK